MTQQHENKWCPECRGPLTPLRVPPKEADYYVRLDQGNWNVSKIGPNEEERPMIAAYECPVCDVSLQLLTTS